MFFAEDSLEQSTSFQQLCAMLPRLVLRTRTRFSAFLARTFFLTYSGLGPCTAVFPLPLPEFGLFGKQVSLNMNRKKWHQLCRKRLLHVLVVFLNYQYNGLHPVSSDSLRRSPNLAQQKVYQHLRGLVAASDQTGDFPLAPGRSGPEFIARLIELSTFAQENSIFDTKGYAGASESAEAKIVGHVQKHYVPASEFTPVMPYRSLDAGRLKLTGTGSWPMANYLEGSILWLPFVEPRILQHGYTCSWPGPSFVREKEEENLKLAMLWSTKGLLALFDEPAPFFSRVFNAYKNETTDRQIGDRRFMNGAEFHPRGPSADLPAGVLLTSLHCPRGYRLIGCVSDRRDFYHQAEVTRERAFTNMLPFAFDATSFAGSPEIEELYGIIREPVERERHGDFLGLPWRRNRKSVLCRGGLEKVYASFKSLFQGDHLGVEYALQSHSSLLQGVGLLDEGTVILRNHLFPEGPVWQGLVIDDFFTLSREKITAPPASAASVALLHRAEAAYAKARVLGSDDKTIAGSDSLKAIGAEINSTSKVLGSGLSSVGAPVGKRVALAILSLRVAQLPIITRGLASRLAGNWVSVLMFRRCLTCILERLFGLGNHDEKSANEVLELSRPVAEELVLAAIASFLAITDVSVPYSEEVFATDASMHRGAITSTFVSEKLVERLWLGGDRKGAYTRLDSPAASTLRMLGEETYEDLKEEELFETKGPYHSLDFAFDFVEICGGSGVLSAAAAKLGLRVCTPIELSASKHFDILNPKLIDWIMQMIAEKRFRSLALEPPCTTFSPAQHPASRSYESPLGFDRKDRKTLLGNALAFRCIVLAWFAYRFQAPSLLEQPRLSKMAWLSAWKFLLSLGFEEAIVASCMLGSIHRKEFRLLTWGLDVAALDLRCSGGHDHVRIEGKYTKESAVYTEGVALHLAKAFVKSLQNGGDPRPQNLRGHESVILNDLLIGKKWDAVASWPWKYVAHINVLESQAYVALLNRLAVRGGSLRFLALLDSRVAKGAHGKGRSSARTLQRSVRRASAITVAGNLHPSFGFAPTRLNTADAPTRNKELPQPSKHALIEFMHPADASSLHALQFSKTAANWIRLILLASFCLCPEAQGFDVASAVAHQSATTSYAGSSLSAASAWTPWESPYSLHPWISAPSGLPGSSWTFGLLPGLGIEEPLTWFPLFQWAFGFLPGLGVEELLTWFLPVVLLSFSSRERQAFVWTFLSPPSWAKETPKYGPRFEQSSGPESDVRSHCLGPGPLMSAAMPLEPRGPEDVKRAALRSATALAADRVLKPRTRSHRDVLLQEFEHWLVEHLRTTLAVLLDSRSIDVDLINEALIGYGKQMFHAGRPFGRFSETINAVAQRRPALRRQLGPTWDLAFNWVVDEPRDHHPALPLSVLLAVVGLSLLWGWSREAAIFGLAWAGILRIGEIFQAVRSDLILPGEAAPGFNSVILKIRQPKTRGTAARHQCSRVDYPDIVLLVATMLRPLPPADLLWDMSPETLRRRFALVLKALGLDTERKPGRAPYSLASLRPGGATHLLQQTEDSELVRRKGRWLSSRVLEIYLQEAGVATYTSRMSHEAQSRIASLAENFQVILKKAVFLKEHRIPERCWAHLW